MSSDSYNLQPRLQKVLEQHRKEKEIVEFKARNPETSNTRAIYGCPDPDKLECEKHLLPHEPAGFMCDNKTWSNGTITITVNMLYYEVEPSEYDVWVNDIYRGWWTAQTIDEFCKENGISCPDFKDRKDYCGCGGGVCGGGGLFD